MEPQSPRPLGHLVAALSARSDVESLTVVLTESLADMLPAQVVQVERRRTAGDRLHGRPGVPVRLVVHGTDRDLVLHRHNGRTEAEIVHVVHGVELSHRAVSMPEWIEALAGVLDQHAASAEAARVALEKLLLG